MKLPTPKIPPETSLDTLALTVQPLVYLFVLFSVLVHGLSIPFFTLGRNVHSRVHSMTRTWTQASGNEPSWLSRVKRVDQTMDGDPVDVNQERLPPSLETPPTPVNHGGDLEKQLDPISEGLAEDHAIVLAEKPRSDSHQEFNHVPHVDRSPSPAQAPHPSAPANQTIHGATPLTRSSSRFRLGHSHRRTSEEEQARKQEKLIRDEWCRKERIDVIKRGEEMVYKSGRHVSHPFVRLCFLVP